MDLLGPNTPYNLAREKTTFFGSLCDIWPSKTLFLGCQMKSEKTLWQHDLYVVSQPASVSNICYTNFGSHF